MDSPDLHFKYQKLAFEYSKLRAQNQVLKKAVIEEQEKSVQLRDILKSKDQNLRKSEQEIDSLSLRNQQLTKRLTLLQDDLEIIKNKQQKGRTNLDPRLQISNDNNVYAEELEAKIRDNAKLHAELDDLELFYKNKVSELETHLEEVSKVVKETSEEKNDDQHLQNEIKKLENERILQEVYGQQRESRILALEEQLKPFIQLEIKLDVHASSVASLFSPDKRPNNLSDILEGTSKLISRGKLLFNLSKPLEEICVGFSKFYFCYASLLKSSSSQSASKLKVIHHLVHENDCWHLLFKRYEEMCSGIEKDETVRLENLIGLNEFNNAFNNCTVSLRKLLPVLSERWDCFQDGQIDSRWNKILCRIVSCFAAVNPYISSLAAHRDGRVILTASAIRKILHFLHERICKLHFTSKELLAALELVNIEEGKKEEFKIILSSIENAFNKIISIFWEDILMNKNVESANSGSSSSAYSRSPGTPHLVFNQNIGNFESPDSNVMCENIGDSIQFISSATCLTQQLSQATNRLAKLEEEREHWRLECQLLSHRLNKESMIAEELQGLPKCQDKTNEDKIAVDDITNISSTSIMSEIVGLCSSEEREKEIRNHFTNRCSQLYMQLTSCISQAALYQNECENLLKQLAILEDTKQATEREVEKQRSEKIQIQETLSTTSRNYEEQISTMSDHLADLNEKITLQADDIEHLEFELKKKTKK